MATPKVNETTFTVGAQLEKDYGAIKVRFSYAETFNSVDGHTHLTGKAKCLAAVNEMFSDYETEELPRLKQAEYQRNIEQPSEKSGTWMDATEFAHEQKNGKDYYNVKAGRFTKFGVACWDECDGRAEAIAELGSRWKMPVKWKVLVDETGKYPKCISIDMTPF